MHRKFGRGDGGGEFPAGGSGNCWRMSPQQAYDLRAWGNLGNVKVINGGTSTGNVTTTTASGMGQICPTGLGAYGTGYSFAGKTAGQANAECSIAVGVFETMRNGGAFPGGIDGVGSAGKRIYVPAQPIGVDTTLDPINDCPKAFRSNHTSGNITLSLPNGVGPGCYFDVMRDANRTLPIAPTGGAVIYNDAGAAYSGQISLALHQTVHCKTMSQTATPTTEYDCQ